MPEYKCSGCDYKSDVKKNVKDHASRKNKCSNEQLNIINLVSNFNCDFCKQTFSIKSNLNRHLKNCKVKKTNLEKELIIEKEKNDKLERENEILKALVKKPSTINNTTNNNNQININLAPWNNPTLPDNVENIIMKL